MARRQGRRNTPNGYIQVDGGVTLHHIEVEGCIVNIREGLVQDDGHKRTYIEILADDCVGDTWKVGPDGKPGGSMGIPVIKTEKE